MEQFIFWDEDYFSVKLEQDDMQFSQPSNEWNTFSSPLSKNEDEEFQIGSVGNLHCIDKKIKA